MAFLDLFAGCCSSRTMSKNDGSAVDDTGDKPEYMCIECGKGWNKTRSGFFAWRFVRTTYDSMDMRKFMRESTVVLPRKGSW